MYLEEKNNAMKPLFGPKRVCLFGADKDKETPGAAEGAEDKGEKPTGLGVSIDVPADEGKKDEDREKEEAARKAREAAERLRKAEEARRAEEARKKAEEERIQREKEEAEKLRKQKLTEMEKIVKDRYGGDFYKMADLPGLQNSELKSEFHMSAPDLSDEKFKGKKPRVICWFHQNGGQDYGNAQSKKMFELVEEMRKNGEPVILVMPQDNDAKSGGKEGNWDSFEKPEVFKKMMEQVEKVAGAKIDDITFGSSSGGYKGIARTLRAMRIAGEGGDAEAKKRYESIKQIGFCDSLYGEQDEIAEWAAKDPARVLHSYSGTEPVHKANMILKNKIRDLLEKAGKKMGENIDIPDERHPAGHDVDRSTLARYMHRPIESLPESVEEGEKLEPLNFPPRSPDAMTGSQFLAAIGQCKTIEEKRQLTIEQALKGAFSPESMTPKYRAATVDGKKVRVPIYTNLSYGTEDDKVTLTPDGVTMQILADMLGGNLPPSEFYRNLYGDPEVAKMPFFSGEQLERLVNERRAKEGLPPLNINNPDGKRSGKAMKSAEYMKAEHDMQMQWLRMHGYKPDQLALGARKTVFMPNDNGLSSITFGGGLYAQPIVDPESGKIVDFKVTDNIVQGIGDTAHEPSYADYSSGGDMIGSVIEYDGEEIALDKVRNDPKYKHVAEALKQMGLGKLLNPTKYKYDESMQKIVAEYQARHPHGSYHPPKYTPSEKPEASAEKDMPPLTPESASPSYVAAPSGGGASPMYGGGSYGGSGPAYEAAGAAPAYAPASYEQPIKPEQPKDQIELANAGNVFVLGDSLSDGFINGMKTPNVKHVLPIGKEKAMGQTAHEMVTTLKEKILKQNVEGATLVIVGGSNDIFALNSLEQIKRDLTEIWTLAKAAKMKVIGATLPPLAYSTYSKNWAAKTNTPYKEYNKDLVQRWQQLNQWIIGQEGAKDQQTGNQTGPDKVIQLHKQLEDPNVPGKLREGLWNEKDGVHPGGSGYMEMADLLKQGIGAVNPEAVKPVQEQGAIAPMTSAQASQNAAWRKAFPEGAKPGANQYAAEKAKELLTQMNMGESQTFTDPDTGKKYMAVKEWHAGDSGHPNPHPGVSVAEIPDEGGKQA